MTAAIVWFRRDLRLEDNPALDAALRGHASVVCAYVHAPAEEAPWQPGAASRWWLHRSLQALEASLRKRGASLHIARGPTVTALDRLIAATGARAVYWNRLYEPALIARDVRIKQRLRERGVEAQSFNANLMVEPWDVRTRGGGPYKVFTPFWRSVRASLQPSPPIPAPRRIPAHATDRGVALDALRLLPRERWERGLESAWQPGEAGALEALCRFRDDALAGYRDDRDRPDLAGTSALSPHLHFGEIGPRQIIWPLLRESTASERVRSAADAYIRELGWREFSHHLLYHFPHTTERNLNPRFDAFPWAGDEPLAVRRWQLGETGIPIIDAGMRQLWCTGWMHNRVRMLVASFLTKNLRQHWLHGARWFWDTLVDADLANNTQGWQWTAGSGADAAPYFRIFNPVTQAERFDPEGAYVRRWVPELAATPTSIIQQPWKDPSAHGGNYPEPMLDLRATRDAALAAYRSMRGDFG